MNNLIIVNIRVFSLDNFLMNAIKNNIYIERISYKFNLDGIYNLFKRGNNI